MDYSVTCRMGRAEAAAEMRRLSGANAPLEPSDPLAEDNGFVEAANCSLTSSALLVSTAGELTLASLAG